MPKKVSEIINGRRVIVKKPELLAPAGNLEKLKTAILYGADAVFIGGKEFSLRSSASNFSLEDIQEAVAFASEHGAHIHVTTNIVMHEENLEGLEDYLKALDALGVTAIICADPHVILTAKRLGLKMETHLSTQMSTTNEKAIAFWQRQGVDRVVLAREVSYAELKQIRVRTDLDLEYFIHGAMCINLSGRCMLSNYYSRRDANRGGCSQSCRWFYQLYDKEGQPVGQEPFTMSSRDLSLLREIPALIELGIDSFKIEGRMKSIHYIATVVSCYRKLIDAYCADPDGFVFDEFYEKEIAKAANRSLGKGFFYGVADKNGQLFNLRDEHPTQEFVMRVISYDPQNQIAKVEQRNHFRVGQQVEFFSPSHPNYVMTVEQLYNEAFEPIEVANHPMEILYLKVDRPLLPNDMARKVRT